jgi:hypothetical protein
MHVEKCLHHQLQSYSLEHNLVKDGMGQDVGAAEGGGGRSPRGRCHGHAGVVHTMAARSRCRHNSCCLYLMSCNCSNPIVLVGRFRQRVPNEEKFQICNFEAWPHG